MRCNRGSWPVVVLVASVFTACGDPPLHPRRPPPVEPPLGSFITDIPMPTYERSGETVHPDFAVAPGWWDHGGPGYLAITPYPDGDATKENPSLFRGSLDHWVVPDGAPNPVRLPSAGHLSDPDVLFNPDLGELWMYYRRVAGGNTIRLVRTGDAVVWSEPVTVVEGPNHTIVSPAIVRRGPGQWLMWSVNSGSVGCSASATTLELRQSNDGIHWSKPQQAQIAAPAAGLMPWHIDVQWVESRGEYWAIFNAKDAHACGTTVVYAASSRDGTHWRTRAEPLLVAGEVEELKDIVYRSTFHVDEARGEVVVWYSGASRTRSGMAWRTIAQRMTASHFFGTPSMDRSLANSRRVPPSVPIVDPP
jgi:hypothetical protein